MMTIKFRDETTGNFYTQGLFLELSYADLRNAVYTLKDFDYEFKGKTYISIKRLYLEIGDPTEYEFAQACFEGCDDRRINRQWNISNGLNEFNTSSQDRRFVSKRDTCVNVKHMSSRLNLCKSIFLYPAVVPRK